MTTLGTLPADFLEVVRAALASLHLREQRRREQAAGLLVARAGYGDPVELQPGLSDAEVQSIEEQLGLRFPPDLRSFLQFVVPVRGDQFPNWREEPLQQFESDQDWLLRGIWGDVDSHEAPHFAQDGTGARLQVVPEFEPRIWSPAWGPVPPDRGAAYAAIHEQFERAPRLIRVFAHRFIPATPGEAGNPVFSIVQTDIIHYGNDLADYFAREFGVPRQAWTARSPKEIPYWSDLIRLNDG